MIHSLKIKMCDIGIGNISIFNDIDYFNQTRVIHYNIVNILLSA